MGATETGKHERRAKRIAFWCILASIIYFALVFIAKSLGTVGEMLAMPALGAVGEALVRYLTMDWISGVFEKTWIIGVIAWFIELPLHEETRNLFISTIGDETKNSADALRETSAEQLVNERVPKKIQDIIAAHGAMLHAQVRHDIIATVTETSGIISTSIEERVVFEGADRKETAQCFAPFDNTIAEIHEEITRGYNYETSRGGAIGFGNDTCFNVNIAPHKAVALRLKYQHGEITFGGQLRFNAQPVFTDKVKVLCRLPPTLDAHLLGVAHGLKLNEWWNGDDKVIELDNTFPRQGLNIELQPRRTVDHVKVAVVPLEESVDSVSVDGVGDAR